MKFRIAATLILVVILVALAYLINQGGTTSTSFAPPAGFEDAKNFKID